MNVRKATVEDLPRVLDLIKQFVIEGRFNTSANDYFLSFWSGVLDQESGVIFIHGDFEAVLGAIMLPDPVDGVITACEMFWFSPATNGKAALSVFNAFEKWAAGASRTTVFHFAHMQAERLSKFYTRRGYTMLQAQYMKLSNGEGVVL